MIKTFRGLLADGGQDRIRLQTIKGKVGYRITKFEAIPNIPANANCECTVQIFKTEQTTVVGTIDFTDSDLLAAIFYNQDPSPANNITQTQIIDIREIFNQDIFITNLDENASVAMNYYLELEVIPLDDAGAEYTTLKDMRQSG